MNVFAMMARKVQELVDATSEGFSFTLPEGVDWHKPHVFVSNHRDIMLDASLLELVFYRNHLPQPAALAGTNLMTNPAMIKVCRANKVFSMPRGDGGRRAFYESMQQASQQIRGFIDEGTSVWIAQRNGRTKDGYDRTDPAVLKMLCLSGADRLEAILDLGITPMSISYEWEPCDILKARELMIRSNGEYHKAPHEDEKSILTGINQQKGHIHLTIGQPLTREQLQGIEGDLMTGAASLLDTQIWNNYRLWPNNYIARDILLGTQGNEYSAEERQRFEAHISEHPELRQWLLGMYAAPLMREK